ncbi:unnamed protein product [Rhodiola kirilowii]
MTRKVSSKHKDGVQMDNHVLNQKPVHSNNFGQFFEVCADKFSSSKTWMYPLLSATSPKEG